MSNKNKIFAYLTGATITASSGVAGALLPAPDTVSDMSSDADWEELDLSGADEKRATSQKGGKLETATGQNYFDELESELSSLSDSEIEERRASIVDAIISVFQDVGGITRTWVVSEWALSDSPERRRLIASVLSHDFYCLGSMGAASLLISDPDPRVRREMIAVVVSRMPESPEHYRTLLNRLAVDPDKKTRRAARRVLHELSEQGIGA